MDAIGTDQAQRMWERFATNGGLTLEQARAASKANALRDLIETIDPPLAPEIQQALARARAALAAGQEAQ